MVPILTLLFRIVLIRFRHGLIQLILLFTLRFRFLAFLPPLMSFTVTVFHGKLLLSTIPLFRLMRWVRCRGPTSWSPVRVRRVLTVRRITRGRTFYLVPRCCSVVQSCVTFVGHEFCVGVPGIVSFSLVNGLSYGSFQDLPLTFPVTK